MKFILKKIKIFIHKDNVIIWGNLSKFKNWELQIDKSLSNSDNIHISICGFKRLFADLVFACEANLGKFFWGNFIVTDTRIWDSHTDKPITWEEYKNLPEKREGKAKFKFRKTGKEKWYYSSKFLKLYNLDFLNDPNGITIDFSFFPFLMFVSMQLGNHPRHSSCLSFNIGKTPVGFIAEVEFCLFGYFLEFKIGENTFTRNANLEYVEDFQRLIAMGKNLYIENLLEKQIERKNLVYIQAIINEVPELYLISDKVLILAAYNDFFKKDIFDFLIKNAKHFNSWNEIKKDIDIFDQYAVNKLKFLANNRNSN